MRYKVPLRFLTRPTLQRIKYDFSTTLVRGFPYEMRF
jgi:hypothetical protein